VAGIGSLLTLKFCGMAGMNWPLIPTLCGVPTGWDPWWFWILLWGGRNSLHKITWFYKSFTHVLATRTLLNSNREMLATIMTLYKDVGPGFNSRSPQQKRSRATRYTQCKQVYHKWYATEVDWLSNTKSSWSVQYQYPFPGLMYTMICRIKAPKI